MKFQNTGNKKHSKKRGTEPILHKGTEIKIVLTQRWKLEGSAMPQNAEEKLFPIWNSTHPDYQSSSREGNKNNFRHAKNKCIILQCWRSEV